LLHKTRLWVLSLKLYRLELVTDNDDDMIMTEINSV